jgi:hypothetical protein
MDPSALHQSFASPKRMPRASISHACFLLCPVRRHVPPGIALAMERKCMRLFFALSAAMGFVVMGADYTNA